jgi:hypothetical protein
MTKNGDSRVVPLSTSAIQTLAAMPRSISGAVFPITACALAANFDKAVARAKLPDLHFHDLRHTAITQMATAMRCRPSAVLGQVLSPPWCPHFCVLLDLRAGLPYCCFVQDDLAVQRRQFIRLLAVVRYLIVASLIIAPSLHNEASHALPDLFCIE